MRERELDGKICLVAGASQGMGRVTALAAGQAGAKVIVASRRPDVCADVAEEIVKAGGEAVAHPFEATEAESVESLLGFVRDTYGRLDLAFNNVGKQQGMAPLHEIPLDRWDRAIGVNLSSAFWLMKYEVPLMKQGGVIVNNSSAAGVRGVKHMADYAAVKWGVIGLTKSAALDYGKQNIRVNVIVPGIIETEAFKTNFSRQYPERVQQFRDTNPMGHFGTMDDVADVVLWLFSDRSKYVTGAVIPIEGGDTSQ